MKETYQETPVEKIDYTEILAILEIMKLKNAKLFLSGKNIIKNETKRIEKYMKTKYTIFPKPNLSNKSNF